MSLQSHFTRANSNILLVMMCVKYSACCILCNFHSLSSLIFQKHPHSTRIDYSWHIVQYVSWTDSSCRAEILHRRAAVISVASPSAAPAPGNHPSSLQFYEIDFFRFNEWLRPGNIYLSLSGLSHGTSHPPSSATLLWTGFSSMPPLYPMEHTNHVKIHASMLEHGWFLSWLYI